MRLLFQVFVFYAILFTLAFCRSICYKGYGCFNDSYPFSGSLQRPISVLPQTPAEINTRFTLYNQNITVGVYVNTSNVIDYLNASLLTKIIVHGFCHDSLLTPWDFDMKDAILRGEDANVIIVNWTKGGCFPYTQATANTQLVGVEIANLINLIVVNSSTSASSFHCIGHSLGAHTCGYAGEKVVGLGRITGLDPVSCLNDCLNELYNPKYNKTIFYTKEEYVLIVLSVTNTFYEIKKL